MYHYSRWRMHRRKVKEKNVRFLVARTECMTQKGREHVLIFLISQGYKTSSNLAKLCCEKVGKGRFSNYQGNGSLSPSFSKWGHIACSRGKSVKSKERSSPT